MTPTIIVVSHAVGPSQGDGTPSFVFDVAFRLDCPANLVTKRPVSIVVDGNKLTSVTTSKDPGISQQEGADLTAGLTLEFFVPGAGGEISVKDAATADSNGWGIFSGILNGVVDGVNAASARVVDIAKVAGVRWSPSTTPIPPPLVTVIGVPASTPVQEAKVG